MHRCIHTVDISSVITVAINNNEEPVLKNSQKFTRKHVS